MAPQDGWLRWLPGIVTLRQYRWEWLPHIAAALGRLLGAKARGPFRSTCFVRLWLRANVGQTGEGVTILGTVVAVLSGF